MIVEADSIACMSRIIRGAGPIEQSSIFELVTVCGDGEGGRSRLGRSRLGRFRLGAGAACPNQTQLGTPLVEWPE